MAQIRLKELEEFVENTKFSNEPLRLDTCTVIENRKNFAKSHLQVLKANSGKKLVMPYYVRLVKFYKLIQDEKLENQ